MLPLLLVASAFSAPIPTNSETWLVGFGAHPKESALVLVATDITVNPRGYASSCNPTVSIGDAAWGPFVCALIRERANFKPAKIDGRAVYGITRIWIPLVQHGPYPNDLKTWNFEVPVKDPPSDVKFPLLRRIQFVVDAAGSIVSCGAAGKPKHPELAVTACADLPGSSIVKPARTASNDPVESVQDAAIRFISVVQP